MVSARITVLKPNDNIPCSSTSRRISRDVTSTSETWQVMPMTNEKTANGESKSIISSVRRRPERVCPQSQHDNRGHNRSEQKSMVRVHLRNRLQHPRHAAIERNGPPFRKRNSYS